MAKGKKTGGRVKGTPNKYPLSVKERFAHLLDKCSDPQYGDEGVSLLEQDILSLDAKDRIYALTKLAEFVMPKMQAVSLSTEDDTQVTIENRLVELSQTK